MKAGDINLTNLYKTKITMKKIFTALTVVAATLFGGATAFAQSNTPVVPNGYYRMQNQAFQEYASTPQACQFVNGDITSSDAGAIFSIKTGPLASIADAMAELQARLDRGEITQAQYTQLFIQLLSGSNSWYFGKYPLESFVCQGFDYQSLIEELPDLCDAAIETFLNEDADDLYKEYYSTLLMLCAMSQSGFIYPADIASADTFKAWCLKTLTAIKGATKFQIYVDPISYTYEVGGGDDWEDDEEYETVYTGACMLRFHTPPYSGDMKKAFEYVNMTNPGLDFDLWTQIKEYVAAEIVKEYGENSPELNLAKALLDSTYMDIEYLIGEGENGEIMVVPIPDVLGSNGITMPTDQQLLQCSWIFEGVGGSNPFTANMNVEGNDGNYYCTINTPFPFQVAKGMTAYYATSVSNDGEADMVEITDGKVPANTPVILKNNSKAPADNVLTILDNEPAAINGNVLKGTIFAQPNPGTASTMIPTADGPRFIDYMPNLPGNYAYYDGAISGVGSVNVAPQFEGKMYDMLGREVKDANAKGIFIINGKKVVKF